MRGTSSLSQPTQLDQAYSDMMSSIVKKARQDLAQANAREEEELEHMLSRTDRDRSGFVHDIDTYIEAHQATRLQRQQQLCRSWHAKVYDVIQGQVDAQIARLTPSELNTRRNELMESYLRTSNQKAHGLFRDIIFASGYDPMRAHGTGICYSASSIADPLKAELAASIKARRALTAKGGPASLGRPTLDVTMWSKLDATPYKPTSPSKLGATGARCETSTSLQGIFDHFYPTPIAMQ
jgi:hypothetical protein